MKTVLRGNLLSIIVFFLVACGGSSSGSGDDIQSTNTISETVSIQQNLVFSFTVSPILMEETTVTVLTQENLNWEVLSEPSLSALQLVIAPDTASANFTPSVSGDYELSIATDDSTPPTIVSFTVLPQLSFDEVKMVLSEGATDLNNSIGYPSNQVWVFSLELSEADLRALFESDDRIEIIGFHPIEGLLIEYDDSDDALLEEILNIAGVHSIERRIIVGDAVEETVPYYTPNDSFSFFDYDENWYLEERDSYNKSSINAEAAWDITRGSDQVLVGIIDNGFYYGHEDLQGKVIRRVADKESHGTAVLGTIAANTNNGLGSSGINHVSRVVTGRFSNQSEYLNVLTTFGNNGSQVKVVNNSWGPSYSFSEMLGSIISDEYPTSNWKRKVAMAFDGSLHVWAAGNRGIDAKDSNGGLHMNGAVLSKVDNAVIVGAAAIDGILFSYSNYGSTIDIAAPSEFYAPAGVNSSSGAQVYYRASNGNLYGEEPNDESQMFGGTSAAAPVVSGVASLVYSLYPGFTGAEVKTILFEGASGEVTHRRDDEGNLVLLSQPIPLVDALGAVELAQEIIESWFEVQDSFDENRLTLTFSPTPIIGDDLPINEAGIDREYLKVSAVTWTLNAIDEDGEVIPGFAQSGTRANTSSISSSEIEVEITTNSSNERFSLEAEVTLIDERNNEAVAKLEDDYVLFKTCDSMEYLGDPSWTTATLTFVFISEIEGCAMRSFSTYFEVDNGLRNGRSFWFDDDGEIAVNGNYKDEMKHGTFTSYFSTASEVVRSETLYSNDLRQDYVLYNREGMVEQDWNFDSEGNYILRLFYYENSTQVMRREEYNNDESLTYLYRQNGSLDFVWYRNGDQQQDSYYNEDGSCSYGVNNGTITGGVCYH